MLKLQGARFLLKNLNQMTIRDVVKYYSNTVKFKKTTQLRNILQSKNLEFLMEAHNAISAKIVEESGFKAIWASGFSISAQLGLRDSNEASWTQVVEIAEFMSDATSIPILFDADTGYGNFNNARRLVRKLEQRGIAGACVEDKVFPKKNSIAGTHKQILADPKEFSLKIKAMKDAQSDPDFCVIARTEAFMAGYDVNEALKRAEEYVKAGADGILIQSKKADASDIIAFMNGWTQKAPVVIVPTTYYKVSPKIYRDAGVRVAIWATHNLRASVKAMQIVSKQLYETSTPAAVDSSVVPMAEIFRLQNDKELSDAEKNYLPSN